MNIVLTLKEFPEILRSLSLQEVVIYLLFSIGSGVALFLMGFMMMVPTAFHPLFGTNFFAGLAAKFAISFAVILLMVRYLLLCIEILLISLLLPYAALKRNIWCKFLGSKYQQDKFSSWYRGFLASSNFKVFTVAVLILMGLSARLSSVSFVTILGLTLFPLCLVFGYSSWVDDLHHYVVKSDEDAERGSHKLEKKRILPAISMMFGSMALFLGILEASNKMHSDDQVINVENEKSGIIFASVQSGIILVSKEKNGSGEIHFLWKHVSNDGGIVFSTTQICVIC